MGFSTSRSLLINSISNIVALIGKISCMLLVDRLGHRWPLIIGSIVMSITFIIGATLLVKFSANQVNQAAHWGFIAITWVFSFTYAATTGTISWATPARSSTHRAPTFISQVTPIALTNISWRYYILCIVCNLTNALTFWAVFPETSKILIEEMDNLFAEAPIFIPHSKWTPTGEDGKTELEIRTEKQVAMMHQATVQEHEGA